MLKIQKNTLLISTNIHFYSLCFCLYGRTSRTTVSFTNHHLFYRIKRSSFWQCKKIYTSFLVQINSTGICLCTWERKIKFIFPIHYKKKFNFTHYLTQKVYPLPAISEFKLNSFGKRERKVCYYRARVCLQEKKNI